MDYLCKFHFEVDDDFLDVGVSLEGKGDFLNAVITSHSFNRYQQSLLLLLLKINLYFPWFLLLHFDSLLHWFNCPFRIQLRNNPNYILCSDLLRVENICLLVLKTDMNL